MTRKDYVRIAAAVRTAEELATEQGFSLDKAFNLLRNLLVDELRDDNPRFDGTKFRDAATPTNLY